MGLHRKTMGTEIIYQKAIRGTRSLKNNDSRKYFWNQQEELCLEIRPINCYSIVFLIFTKHREYFKKNSIW